MSALIDDNMFHDDNLSAYQLLLKRKVPLTALFNHREVVEDGCEAIKKPSLQKQIICNETSSIAAPNDCSDEEEAHEIEEQQRVNMIKKTLRQKQMTAGTKKNSSPTL
jgi:hypothetical protein